MIALTDRRDRKEMLTSSLSLSLRLFFHFHFPSSSSPLFIPFAVFFSGGLRHVLWHGLSCRRFIRASARVLFPLSTLYFPRKTLVVIVIIDCIVKQNELIANNFTSVQTTSSFSSGVTESVSVSIGSSISSDLFVSIDV